MIFSALVAIANYAIYMSTIDYMVASYGVYSASATGGNGFARDFLAGISAMYASVCITIPFHLSSIADWISLFTKKLEASFIWSMRAQYLPAWRLLSQCQYTSAIGKARRFESVASSP